MKCINLHKKISSVQEKYNDLINSVKIYFNILVPSMLEENIAVVYAIFDKNTFEALDVGRTKNLRRRLYTNHLQGNKSTARLKKYNEAKSWLKEVEIVSILEIYYAYIYCDLLFEKLGFTCNKPTNY